MNDSEISIDIEVLALKNRDLVLLVLTSIFLAYFFYQRGDQTAANKVESIVLANNNIIAASKEPISSNSFVDNKTNKKSDRLRIIADDVIKVKSTALRQKMETSLAVPVVDAVPFVVDDDGLATVDGDIVLGEVVNGGVQKGYAKTPEIILWPDGRIPFFIQGDLYNPERVIKAMALFLDTPIQFVPYQGEENVLVFSTGKTGCKSYLGKIGGKQPIWISPDCGVTEIAHEIMHALGFIHEQNRTDRESFVRVAWENIEDSARINFQLFPESLMIASGKGAFDFHSIMLYHPSAFSKNGQPTMWPTDLGNEISPSLSLSPDDILRLNKLY